LAVQTTVSPGARVVTGQVMFMILPSTTIRSVMVTLPVLVTRNSKSTTSPGVLKLGCSGTLSIVSDGVSSWMVTVLEGGDAMGSPVGGAPVTVAVFCVWPALKSAWVRVRKPVQVVLSPGSRVTTAQVAGASSRSSFTI